jgi:hypothetical protein
MGKKRGAGEKDVDYLATMASKPHSSGPIRAGSKGAGRVCFEPEQDPVPYHASCLPRAVLKPVL